MSYQHRQGYFFIEALVAMMLVSVVMGATLSLLSNASSVSQGNKRQITELMLCEELMENLRQQWFSAVDPVAEILVQIDVDERLPEPLGGMGWRDTGVRCPWPAALKALYSAQYRIQPLLTDTSGELKHVRSGTLFQLQVRVLSAGQDTGTISLITFLPLKGVLSSE
ncbi:MAG: type IV pilus modification PilV family protein [Terrimicrobiaceae bacterium]